MAELPSEKGDRFFGVQLLSGWGCCRPGQGGQVLSPVLSRQSLHVASSPGLSPLVDLGCGTECPWPVFPWPFTHTRKTLPLRALW